MRDKFGVPALLNGVALKQYESPLKCETLVSGDWNRFMTRTGVIARKIGNYPMWLKNGTPVRTTLLQVSYS